MSKENVVIIGGGGAGSAVARELSSKIPKLSSKYNLILVTSHDRYVHLPAMLRMAVSSNDKLEDTALIPYDRLLTNDFGEIKVGTVVSVTSSDVGGTVLLESGEEIPYRYLVLATGSLWEGPLAAVASRTEEYLASVREWRARFQEAQNIVIVGAGSVGLGKLIKQQLTAQIKRNLFRTCWRTSGCLSGELECPSLRIFHILMLPMKSRTRK